MTDFNITLNDEQKDRLTAAGFEGMAEDTDEIMFYTYRLLQYLAYHNKNLTNEQYHRIDALNDIYTALYRGY